MSQENVESALRAFDAFNRRDLDAYLELLDPAVEFRSLLVGMGGPWFRPGGAQHRLMPRPYVMSSKV